MLVVWMTVEVSIVIFEGGGRGRVRGVCGRVRSPVMC